MDVILAGPKLSLDDLRPYAKPGQPKRLMSESVGRKGRIMLNEHKPVYGRTARAFLHAKLNDRAISVSFEHGGPVELVDAGDYFLIRDKAA